jgi:hypothetical protein
MERPYRAAVVPTKFYFLILILVLRSRMEGLPSWVLTGLLGPPPWGGPFRYLMMMIMTIMIILNKVV